MDEEMHLVPRRVSEVETMVGGTSDQFHSACGEEADVVETSLQAKEKDGGVSKGRLPDDSYDRPFATRCYERVLSPTTGQGSGLERILLRDAALVDNPQEAQTFWLPAGCKPTTSLEKIAATIFDFHSKNLWYDKDRVNGRSQNVNLPAAGLEEAIPHRGIKRPRLGREGDDGAEWWIQIRREGEHADLGMPFHWDKDEQLLERHGALVYPAVSTVTYLSDNGAPTVVFKSRATGEGAVVAGSMDQAFVSYPVLFKHLAFDGGFLHGVPQAMMRENSQCYHRHMRVTLLVNVWLSHKPSGVVPLPRSIAASLSRPSDVPELSFERPVEFHPVSVEGTKAANNEGGVLETSGGSTVTVEAPLGPACYLAFHAPSSKKLSTGDCEGRHSFLVSFENGKDARILTRTTEG